MRCHCQPQAAVETTLGTTVRPTPQHALLFSLTLHETDRYGTHMKQGHQLIGRVHNASALSPSPSACGARP